MGQNDRQQEKTPRLAAERALGVGVNWMALGAGVGFIGALFDLASGTQLVVLPLAAFVFGAVVSYVVQRGVAHAG